jgi:molybdate transport system substrate-binding protein
MAGVLAAACGPTSAPASSGPLKVSAAVSLTEALQRVAARWEGDGGRKLTLNFAASNVLARQIMEGAPVDVFLSADEEQMDRLVASGAVDAEDRVDLLTNQLVVVTPGGRALPGAAPAMLASSAVKRVAIGDPQGVPAGVYAKAWLIRAGLWRQVEPKVVPAVSVRAALAAVEAANADAGIVYRTDLVEHADVTLAYAVPVADAPRILYPAAVVKRTSHRKAARALLAFLDGAEALSIFRDAGFPSARDSAPR